MVLNEMTEAAEPAPMRRPIRDGVSGTAYLGRRLDRWSDAYHWLLHIPLWLLLGVMAGAYLALNTVFAGLYLLDPHGVAGARPGSFLDAFFFSAQTLGSVGYGAMWPRSVYANTIATMEMFAGLFNLGAATGLLFAHISRPTARIMFSRYAVVTPLNGVPTLMLRAANQRRNLVLEAEVSLTLVHDVVSLEGERLRRFHELAVVRAKSPVFSLTWQVMHAIDEDSPLYGETTEGLLARRAEILVVMKGTDETFVSTIHARTSYKPEEIIWGRRLADIFTHLPDGGRVIDFSRFHDVE